MTGPIFQWFLREMGQAYRQLRINLSTYRGGEKSHETRKDFKPSLVRAVRIFLEDIGRSLRTITRAFRFSTKVDAFVASLNSSRMQDSAYAQQNSDLLRRLVRTGTGLSAENGAKSNAKDLLAELRFLHLVAPDIRQAFKKLASKRVLFCGQAYYNAWYLSRSLRSLGWKADVYNWDTNPASQIYYHGEDFRLGGNVPETLEAELGFFLMSLYAYDIVHFSNTNGISQGWRVESALVNEFGESSTIHLLKALGRKIVYSNNGCLDGVSQTSFSKWGPVSVCSICRWQNEPSVCNDERNLAWGKFRNKVADFQCILGGNRADYNKDARIHEVPEFYCLDPEVWHPKIEIPENYKLPNGEPQLIRLYHAVGNQKERTREDGVNIKSTHIYLPLIEKMQKKGIPLELISPKNVPNKEVRFLQVQADIFLEMLTFGWFGANAREAMMLGKPVICYIRPEWLEDVRREIPEYAEDLPIVSATPDTVEAVLRDLIADRQKREEIGKKSRAFAVKWHSAESGARRFDEIYTRLLNGDQQLLPPEWFADSIAQQ